MKRLQINIDLSDYDTAEEIKKLIFNLADAANDMLFSVDSVTMEGVKLPFNSAFDKEFNKIMNT